MRGKLIFILLFVSLKVLSQEVFVGRIYDEDTRLPLGGVEVRFDTITTTTNVAGYFQINASSGDLIRASMNGYETIVIKLPNEPRFTFSLRRTENTNQADLVRSFYKYFGENIKYPVEARRKEVQGLVTVYFEVDSLNRVVNSMISRPLEGGCSDEVIRVLASAPAVWFDIKHRTKFVLPVRFRLGNSKNDEKIETPSPGIILLQELVVTAYSR